MTKREWIILADVIEIIIDLTWKISLIVYCITHIFK